MSAILRAYEFDGGGGGNPLADEMVAEAIRSDRLAWVHLDVNHPDTRGWLEKELTYLDPFIVEALLAEETRPRVTQIDDGALIILRGVNLNENADPEDMVSIRLWADSKRIVSLRRRKLKAVLDLEEKIKKGRGPKDAGDFVCALVSNLFQRMSPVLVELDERTDEIEERVMEAPSTQLRQSIVDIRKEAILLRRYMAPQKDAIGQFRLAELTWLEAKHRRQLNENLDLIMRYVEDLDAIRERAQIVKDELANHLADKLNKNLYLLSVVAAIFLPLGFLTGLLGINVGGIPGADNDSSFWIFTGLLAVIVLIQVLIFRKLKWI